MQQILIWVFFYDITRILLRIENDFIIGYFVLNNKKKTLVRLLKFENQSDNGFKGSLNFFLPEQFLEAHPQNSSVFIISLLSHRWWFQYI